MQRICLEPMPLDVKETIMDDILTRMFQGYLTWTYHLSSTTIKFLIRAMLILSIPLILCSISYIRCGTRSVTSQVILMVLGFFIAFTIPLDFQIYDPFTRALVVTITIILLVALPRMLVLWVVPTWRSQVRLATLFYITLFVLFLLNLT